MIAEHVLAYQYINFVLYLILRFKFTLGPSKLNSPGERVLDRILAHSVMLGLGFGLGLELTLILTLTLTYE